MRSSSSDGPGASTARTGRRTWHHLVATLAVATLVLASPTFAPEITGALYTDDASTTMTGFRVRPVCDDPAIPTVPSILGGLATELHWGFAPETPDPWTSSAGDPSTTTDATVLACDDGVLPLEAGQAAWTGLSLADPSTVVLVASRPAVGGTVLTLTAGAGGIDVVDSGTTVSLRAWGSSDSVEVIASVTADAGPVRVLAVEVETDAVTLWLDGQTVTADLPASFPALPPDVDLALGAPAPVPTGSPVPTATFVATELAVLTGPLDPVTLEAVAGAAHPAVP